MQISSAQSRAHGQCARRDSLLTTTRYHAARRLAVRAAAVAPDDGPSTSGAPPAADAWALLKAFTAADARGGAAAAQRFLSGSAERDGLRSALMAVYSQPWPDAGWAPQPSDPDVLIGVVAGDARLAVRALRDWCGALGLPYIQPESKVAGAKSLAAVKGGVYVKYNSKSRACYLTQYQGRDRGVLVQLGTLQLGHFPLGLWDEARANPPPLMA